MVDELKMTTSSEAIPMPYLVSENNQKVKKDDKVIVNKIIKNKTRKRNKGNIIVETDSDNKDVYVLTIQSIFFFH